MKKKYIIALLILVICGIGTTFSYLSNKFIINNQFDSKQYGSTVSESFVSPNGWQPGDVTPKILLVTNTGNVDEAVRVQYEESWVSKNGDALPLMQGEKTAAIIHWMNKRDWTYININGKNYYYYNYKLEPGESTSKLLDSVKFNLAIEKDTTCTTTESNGLKSVKCTSTGNGYDDATYTLSFKIETVQFDKYKEVWGDDFELLEDKEYPKDAYILAAHAVDKDYNDSNKHDLFAINHNDITDYRYIGNDPYNYIYFNCDDKNEDDEDYDYANNCEIWRIIGVFDVDDGEGNVEKRIKLVRGDILNNYLTWNNQNHNEWSLSTTKDYLNTGNYYNRENDAANFGLKDSAKNLIKNAKYYLGAINSIQQLSSNDVYSFERSDNKFTLENYCLDNSYLNMCKTDNYCETINVNNIIYCIERTTEWVGEVALMYPSDYQFTFARGVDDKCFLNNSYCSNSGGGDYTKSWIYNSNKYEGIAVRTVWLLSPNKNEYNKSIYLTTIGWYSDNYSNRYYSIRPVVYLKTEAEIIDGIGSIEEPYILSF